MRTRGRILVCLYFLGTIVGNISTVGAFPAAWFPATSGTFENPGQWFPAGPPGPGDDALFLQSGTYVVTFTQESVINNSLTVQAGNVTFDFVETDPFYGITTTAVIGSGTAAPTSLSVNNGEINVGGQLDVLNGATLRGNQFGEVYANSITVSNGGAIRGRPTFVTNSGLSNHGLVAPGDNGVGTISITSGNFEQSVDGTLEIELRGAGMAPDVLVHAGFSGSVSLGGHLSVPLINGYEPQINDTFTFVYFLGPGTPIEGSFDTLSVPGLPSGVAARIDYGPTETSITFVAPQSAGINSNLLPVGGFLEWNSSALWANGVVPNSSNIANLTNQQGYEGRVQLNPGTPAAITHRTNISGLTHSMTLAVGDDNDFTAVERLNVNNRGILQLAGGTVHSPLVKVNPGGHLIGNGVIDGDVLMGATTGTLRATLSPGASTGTLNITGDLTIATNVDTIIEVVADNDFDKIIVGQDANLGGTLKVDLAMGVDPEDLLGVPLAVISAGDVNFEFDDAILIDHENGYFVDVDYSGLAVAMSVGLDGDMNYNGELDAGDIPLFATGLTNPVKYFTIDVPGESPVDPGNMNEDAFFDFDDIEEFSQLPFPNLTAEEIVDAIFAYTAVVPEPSVASLLVIAFVMGVAGVRRSAPW